MYGQKVLGVDLQLTRELKNSLMSGEKSLRIGFTRVNFNYFIGDDEINYILDAIEFIAKYGWMMLPHYSFDKKKGIWLNRECVDRPCEIRSFLKEVDYSKGFMSYDKCSDESLRGKYPFYMKKGVGSEKPLKAYIDDAYEQLVQTVGKYKELNEKGTVDDESMVD